MGGRWFGSPQPMLRAVASVVLLAMLFWHFMGPAQELKTFRRVSIEDVQPSAEGTRVRLMTSAPPRQCAVPDDFGMFAFHAGPPESLPWRRGAYGEARVLVATDGCELVAFRERAARGGWRHE